MVPDGSIDTRVAPGAGGERATARPEAEHLDVVIIGGGLSGIGAACRLARQCPTKRFAILESRAATGGTWDLFRYPGIRSDSAMQALGYKFRPWRHGHAIAPGAEILEYIRDTASHYRIDRHIRLRHQVRAASFSTAAARWTLDVEVDGRPERMTCDMLLLCSGYYSYAEAHAPEFPGAAEFGGQLVHPQFWPDGFDCAGKRVVVIGSGATAVTLVPALARTAGHVTMLQRSPSYIFSRPSRDKAAELLQRTLPRAVSGRLIRAKTIAQEVFYYKLARAKPADFKRQLIDMVRAELGPDFDVAKHFTPTYDPWDQRICLVPDSDLFAAIREGRASVETDHVERFTATGIRLASGKELEADIIVSATGLKLVAMGGITVTVDGSEVDFGGRLAYKGMMIGDVPNFIFFVGYSMASWTLKVDLVAAFACRLINFMRRGGYDVVVPRADASVKPEPFLNLTSGYVQRAASTLPKFGDRWPWKLHANYLLDMPLLRYGRLKDGTLRFRRSAS